MVTLIGMGSGRWEALSVQAQDAVRRAGLVFGAKRLLAGLPPECTARQFALYQPAEILETLAQAPGQDAAVLYSGDTGFLFRCVRPAHAPAGAGHPCAGVSGRFQHPAAGGALGRPWQDWKLVSAHGCACDPVAECMTERSVFSSLAGPKHPPPSAGSWPMPAWARCTHWWAKTLAPGKRPIRYGSAAELAGQSFAPLSVLLVENFDAPHFRTPGFPDESFIRGQVPMTKQEVRAAALAKLAIAPTDTLWDVGAGTGSVSVEMALAASMGQVYAVECDADACALVRQNQAKFAASNLTLIAGKAPEALQNLPAPDAVFIGGSKGNMQAIVDAALAANPQTRLCIAAIALETLQQSIAALAAHGLAAQVTQIAVSRSKAAGSLHLMMANNPVFLIVRE